MLKYIYKAVLCTAIMLLAFLSSCGGSSDGPSTSSNKGAVTVNEPTLTTCLEMTQGTSAGFTSNLRTVTHHTHSARGTAMRNYTICYDMEHRVPMYVAYLMHNVYMGPQGRTNEWQPDPAFTSDEQANLHWSYGSYTLSRGHMLASGSRTCNRETNEQTFYYTNMSPQLGNFNGERWLEGEDLERRWRNGGIETATVDTLYVVTGPALKTVGSNESINYVVNQNDDRQVAIPNYFFKVFLKRFHKSALSDKVTYRALGLWFKHEAMSGPVQASDCRTIDEIEAMTGLDFFYNLPDNIEEVVEASYDLNDWNGVVQ